MMITKDKKDFIKIISGGIGVLMDGSFLSEEIFTLPECEIEAFIKDNLLVGSSFSPDKFCKVIDDIDDKMLVKLLRYFDDKDITLFNAYTESCVPQEYESPNLQFLVDCVNDLEYDTFTDILISE